MAESARSRGASPRPPHRPRRWSALLLLVLAPALGIVGCDLPPGFFEEVVFTGLTRPTAVEISPDGRVFVSEKRGVVKVFDGVDDRSARTTADLRRQVYNGGDRGLLGLVLHPDFPQTPYLFVTYTLDAGLDGVVPRWGGTGDVDPCPTPPGPTGDGCVVTARVSCLEVSATGTQVGPEVVLVQDWCQQYPGHSIGTIAFGADGALYAGGGDGASYNWADYGQDGDPPNPCGDPGAGPDGIQRPPTAEGGALRAQDLRTPGDPTGLNGSIIRIDPLTGEALPDNPLASSDDPGARRIVAHGFRNPYRFTVRPGTSELWVGDVGWFGWEEIDVTRGDDAVVDNFGWPCFEGGDPHPRFSDLDLDMCEDLAADGDALPPRYRYAAGEPVAGDTCPTDQGTSLSGMAFIPEQTSYPASYAGSLFFADAARGCIYAMRPGRDGLPDPGRVAKFATVDTPVDLDFGPGGELWYVDLYGGEIKRIGYSPDNSPPQASVVATPTSGDVPLTVTFDASASTDADEDDALTFAWDLDGDGDLRDASGPIVTTTYETVGTRTVLLRVTDDAGTSDTATIRIRAGTAEPEALIWSPPPDNAFAVGEVVPFEGGILLDDGTLLDPSELAWWADMLHCTSHDDCHRHPDLMIVQGQDHGSFVMPDHEYPAHIDLHLGALVDGEPLIITRRIDYRTTELTVATDPALDGVPVVLGTATAPAPTTRDLPVGSNVTISAPAVVNGPNGPLHFSAWSDGGARTHEVVVPDVPTTLVAFYAPA